MSSANKPIDSELLKTLVPLESLSADLLRRLAASARMERISSGTAITLEVERDDRALYLLSGMLVLANGNDIKETIKAGTAQARNPLPPYHTRRATLYAKTTATIVSIDRKLLDIVLTQNPTQGESGATETEQDNHAWITNFLQSNALLQLPETTIQTLYNRLQEIPTRAGEIVIRQGSVANSYYIIRNGRCSVVHAPSLEGPEITLAELRSGQAFGEEALITNRTRNASVIMQEAGSLMRLEKQDFMSLLVNPLLRFVSPNDAHGLLATGAEIIDVRLPGNYPERGLVKNCIPLSELRNHLAQLDKSKQYVIACNDGNQSTVAAFLLNQHGFQTHVLQGGLKKFQFQPPANIATQELAKEPVIEDIEILAPSMGGEVINFPRPKLINKPITPPAPSKARETDTGIELPLLTDVVIPGAWKQRHAVAIDLSTPNAQGYMQADMDAVTQRAVDEAKRAQAAELALQIAQAKAQELKAEAASILKRAEEEARKAASDMAKKMTEEHLRTRSKFAAVADEAKEETKKEAQRAQAAEEAWKRAEGEIARLKANLEEIKQRAIRKPAQPAIDDIQIEAPKTNSAARVNPNPAPISTKPAAAKPAFKKSLTGAKPVLPKVPPLAEGQTPTPAPSDIKLGWISDSYLWETVLGYRVDPAVDSLLAPKPHSAKPQPAASPAPVPTPVPAKPAATTQPFVQNNPAAKKDKAAHTFHSSRKSALAHKTTSEPEPKRISARKYEILLILVVILAGVQIGGGDRLQGFYTWTNQQLGLSQLSQSAAHWFNNMAGNSTPVQEVIPVITPKKPIAHEKPRRQHPSKANQER